MLPSWPVFPLMILVALFWTLFKLSISFMYWGTPKWDFLLHRWPHTCKAEGNGCFPRPAGWLLLTQVDRWLFLSTAGIPCWLMFSLPYIRTHTSLSAELLPRLSVSIWFISCARAMTWHLSSWHSCVMNLFSYSKTAGIWNSPGCSPPSHLPSHWRRCEETLVSVSIHEECLLQPTTT